MVNDHQNLDLTTFTGPSGGPAIEWRISDSAVPYPHAVAMMEARAADIAAGRAAEMVWLLEHPPLYTSGTSGRNEDLLDPRFPLFTAGRGGQLTYHGPGQRVAYVMLDLKRRRPDVRAYVAGLEEWIIRTLARFNVRGERREDRVGVGDRALERHRLGKAMPSDRLAGLRLNYGCYRAGNPQDGFEAGFARAPDRFGAGKSVSYRPDRSRTLAALDGQRMKNVGYRCNLLIYAG